MKKYNIKLTEEAKQERKSLAHYKNMAIIFSVEEENAYIHHIIPQKMVVFEVEI